MLFRSPESNPLMEYLDSIKRMKALPAGTRVLPSHGRPLISSLKETYEFVNPKKSSQIDVVQKSSTTYLCNNFRTTIPVAEFYDDKSRIDNVETYINGKSVSYIHPKYSYYSVSDVFYSDAHVCYFDLFMEKSGATCGTVFDKTITDPRYFTSVFFSRHLLIRHEEIVFRIPRWMKVELKEMNCEKFSIKKTTAYDSREDEDVFTYMIDNLRSSESEKNSPGISYTEPHILVLAKSANLPGGKIGYFNTLDDQYAWYKLLAKDINLDLSTVKQKAMEISGSLTNDIDKIKSILFWTYDNVRYLAYEDGIAGFRPDKAEEVLRKKYGDCKGMANLTKEFLKALGFDARLCWLGTNHIAYDHSTPSMGIDNHMICALLYKGQTYFIDPTEKYISFREYAERIQGRQVLIEDGDKYISARVPKIDYHQNLDSSITVLNIESDKLNGRVSQQWKGEEKEYILNALHSIKKETTTDAFTNYLNGGNDNKISELKVSDISNYDLPVEVSYNVLNDKNISSFGNDLYIGLDINKEFSNYHIDSTRQHDYWFPYKDHVCREVEVNIPAGWSINSIPSGLEVKASNYEFSAKYSVVKNKLFYKKNIIIINPYLLRKDIITWNNDINKLNTFYNEQVVISKTK